MFKKSDVLFSGIKEKILIVLISILFLYTCFPYAVNSIALMLFVSLTLITNFQKLQILNKDKTYTFLILNLWIIFLAFTAIISENTDQSGKILLRLFSFTLITFIFLFFISKTIVKYKNLFFLAFVLGNFIFTNIGNLFFSLKISDILFTYVMGRRESFKNLEINSKDFTFCVEFPIKAKRKKSKYQTIPSFERSRIGGIKKVNAFKDGLLILIKMIKMFFIR